MICGVMNSETLVQSVLRFAPLYTVKNNNNNKKLDVHKTKITGVCLTRKYTFSFSASK